MNAERFKAAKAFLGLTNPQLAEMTGLHGNPLNKPDQGEGKAATAQLARLTLEAPGNQFFEDGKVAAGPGVAMKEAQA
ncbi:hypothetical protein [Paracoccus pacificus]|uniref:XRE family transcriptional regulator n=1 Tax=Paracoccus pacificus TaxID=1463598 RepID=A0ABW4R3Z4_9RHOB